MDAWKPQPKVTAAAIAAILAWLLQTVFQTPVPPGVEAAVAVVVAYLVPNTAGSPLEGGEVSG